MTSDNVKMKESTSGPILVSILCFLSILMVRYETDAQHLVSTLAAHWVDGVETTTADTKRDAFRVPSDGNIMLMDEFIDKHIGGALVCTGHYYNTQLSPIVLL